jgi:hypothetical protein
LVLGSIIWYWEVKFGTEEKNLVPPEVSPAWLLAFFLKTSEYNWATPLTALNPVQKLDFWLKTKF